MRRYLRIETSSVGAGRDLAMVKYEGCLAAFSDTTDPTFILSAKRSGYRGGNIRNGDVDVIPSALWAMCMQPASLFPRSRSELFEDQDDGNVHEYVHGGLSRIDRATSPLGQAYCTVLSLNPVKVFNSKRVVRRCVGEHVRGHVDLSPGGRPPNLAQSWTRLSSSPRQSCFPSFYGYQTANTSLRISVVILGANVNGR